MGMSIATTSTGAPPIDSAEVSRLRMSGRVPTNLPVAQPTSDLDAHEMKAV
jgi:hypothetical protein